MSSTRGKAAVDNVHVVIENISDLVIRTRVKDLVLVSTMQFQARIPVPDIALILTMQRQGVPIYISIATPQGAFDLNPQEEKEEK